MVELPDNDSRLSPDPSAGSADSGASPDSKSLPPDLQQVVLTFYEDIYRYAFRLSGAQADAEDLTQQTFLLAHRKLHQLRKTEKLKSWLFAILRSCFLKGVRTQRPLSGSELAVDEIPDRAVGDDGIDRERLRAAIADLPEEFRVVVMMFYFEELSYKEIARELDLPTGTVMSRLSRAKGRLRQRLIAVTPTGAPASDPIRCSAPEQLQHASLAQRFVSDAGSGTDRARQ